MRVNEVMTKGAECTRPDTTLQEAAARMKSLNAGVLPVCGDNDRLVGMLTDRDVTVRSTAAGADPEAARVKDVMTPDVVYCFDDQDVAEAARLMKDNQIGRLVVLNRDKRLVGIVSLGDLATETGDKKLAGGTLGAVAEREQSKR